MNDVSNETIALLLYEFRHLLRLKGENLFKIRAFERAAQAVQEVPDLLERVKAGTLREVPGIGQTIEAIITEFVNEGTSSALNDLKETLPEGLPELTQVSGLGPKKAMALIETLGIRSLPELEYACKENRLLKLKGFGQKAQEKILQGIQFLKSNQGLQRISEGILLSERFLKEFKKACPDCCIYETGALRRRLEILESLEFIVQLGELEEPGSKAAQAKLEKTLSSLQAKLRLSLPVKFHYASSQEFIFEWARTTGTKEHWKALGEPKKESFLSASAGSASPRSRSKTPSDEAFYERLGLPWIPPETRETGEEVTLAKKGKLKDLLGWEGIQGVFHNHTTRSDGTASLEQMVAAAQEMGLKYIGISDHSQSAFYAQGLKAETLRDQEKEIRKVQEQYPDIRIFWGTESDILSDGSLDYPKEILKKFDFVIASIHSRFQMDRAQMTHRVIKAIRNPYTRFLGHPTGRLLLGRSGYELDLEKVMDAAAECQVAIELNSNPARLDLDWRWGPEMRKKKVFTSINPDAHETDGLADIKYGITMCRKAMIPTQQVVNAKSVQEVDRWLRRA